MEFSLSFSSSNHKRVPVVIIILRQDGVVAKGVLPGGNCRGVYCQINKIQLDRP